MENRDLKTYLTFFVVLGLELRAFVMVIFDLSSCELFAHAGF
jgi:hypothetical protein